MIKYLSRQNLKKFSGKTCLLRVDLNVEESMPLDSYRLEAVLPTIKLLLKHKVKVVILSHRGRPVPNTSSRIRNRAYSLFPFGFIFAQKLNVPIDFVYAARLGALKMAVRKSTARLVLVENLRFFKGEETNDPAFARGLARMGDFYVNDAFAVSHRANASVAAIAKFLPSYAGLLMEREIRNLETAMGRYKKPLTLIIGGAKISDKLGVMKYFWNKAENFLVGGAPANTILKAEGMNVGGSLVDTKTVPLVRPYLNFKKVHLPVDLKWRGTKILDVGPKTVKEYAAIIKKSRTIIWNGPMGWFETKGFGGGTREIWRTVLANKKANVVIGGGETITSLGLLTTYYKLPTNVFLSTGGGAMLEYLSGKKLPGIESLK